jgi:hypothetical protein
MDSFFSPKVQMLLIGIVTNTKAFELVLIIHESHSSMEVFLGGAFFFFLFFLRGHPQKMNRF